ncbi:MAG: DUF3300 domain-containing protein [Deltaproteobacteria bacterium]
MRSLTAAFCAIALLSGFLSYKPAFGQDAPEKVFSTEQLDQMLAPVALYPDEVLANVLMASTYPLDVVQAARWIKEPQNKKLKGDALAKALEAKPWDPSIKALTLFPEVLNMMSDQLEWTQNLGDAFLAQEDEVFARVQFLREKADAAGNLKSNKQQTVKKEVNPETKTQYIVIEPAQPEYVYVPVYQPTVVYGSWWYPSYPPYYWNWYPGASFVNGLFWGAGFAVANEIWGWNRFDWRRGDIDIDINRYNNINVNRPAITNNTWQHNSVHRGPVPYRDKATRDKFAKDTNLRDKSKDFSGFDKGSLDKTRDIDRVKDKLGTTSDGKFKDKTKDLDLSRDKLNDKMPDRGGDKMKDKTKDFGGDKLKDKSGAGNKLKDIDRPKTKDIKPATKDIKPQTRDIKKIDRPTPKALDVKPKAQVQKHIDRGGASRAAARSHPKARAGGGGGGGRAGGGGGRRGGRR